MITRGIACAASGVLGVALGALTIGWPAAVDDNVWSYPFSYGAALAIGIALAVVHLMTLCGYLAVLSLGGRPAVRKGLVAAAAGLAMLAACEIAGGAIGDEHTDSPAAGVIGAMFGAASLLVAVGSMTAGVLLVRTSQRQAAEVGWLVMLSGAILVVLVTPANMSGNLDLRMAALMLWSAFFIALGLTVVRLPVRIGAV